VEILEDQWDDDFSHNSQLRFTTQDHHQEYYPQGYKIDIGEMINQIVSELPLNLGTSRGFSVVRCIEGGILFLNILNFHRSLRSKARTTNGL
jgi:hypothetical protein